MDAKPVDTTFSDIIRGMQYAVNTAQEMLANYHLQMIESYFNEDGTPKNRTIKINDKVITIAEIALIPHNNLIIDELSLDFAVAITAVDKKQLMTTVNAFNTASDRSSFSVEFARDDPDSKQSKVDVKIKFKSAPPTEGAHRMIDHLTTTI